MLNRSSFLFSRDCNDLPFLKRFLYRLWLFMVILLSSAGITTLSLLLGIGMMDIQFFFDYFRQPLLFLLNMFPVLILQLLLYCLFGRQWLSFLTSSVFILLCSIGDFYKLKFRSEPFLFSDLRLIHTAINVANNYNLTPNVRIIVSVIFVFAGTLILAFTARGRWRKRTRVILPLLVFLLLYPLWRFVYTNEAIYHSPEATSPHVIPGWEQQAQISKGFLYQFLYSTKESSSLPEGYDSKQAQEWLASYPDCDISSDRKYNLLVFQLEAFCDLRETGIEGISDDVYADYDRLKQESLSGVLVPNVFAGGTLDTERCFLTGSNRLEEYSAPAYSYIRWLRAQGYTTVGSHPNYQSFYNRINVNQYLGFDDYWFTDNHYKTALSSLENSWYSDHILFPSVTEQFLSLSAESPVFSFNVTMQGHGPYPGNSLIYDEFFFSDSSISEEANIILNNYLGSIHETLTLLTATAAQLQESPLPIIMVFYGDHKPWLGDNNSVYKELGIDLNTSSESSFLNQFSTPYVIWANHAAKEKMDLSSASSAASGPTVSPGFLMNVLSDYLNWEGNSFMHFTNEVKNTLPVIHSNGYYLENDVFTRTISESSQELINKYNCIQYYLKTNYVS
jgi:phosphoglycerol transferase MdoB-like AlkP superfamily enzyme